MTLNVVRRSFTRKKVSRKKKAQSFKFSLDRLSLPLPKRLRPTCVFRFFFDDCDLKRCHVIAT